MNIEQAMRSAIQCHQEGKLAEAETLYRQVLAIQSDHPDALHLLGVIAHGAGQHDVAAHLVAKSLQVNPANPVAHTNMGAILRAQGKFSEACAACRQAIRLMPEQPEGHVNLGNCLSDLGLFDQAADSYREAIRLRPDKAKYYTNLGGALSDQGKLAESIAAHRQAIALDPDFAGAHWNLSLVQLLQGDPRGWDEYEWRWRFSGFSSVRRDFRQPLWEGEPLHGRTILLHAEQGLGDTIQFVRYVPPTIARGARVILECHASLLPLLKNVAGIERVVAAGEPLPQFDVHCPLLSLPRALKMQSDPVGNSVPYLGANPTRVQKWASKVASSNKLKVGIAWAGNPTHRNDRNRSLHPGDLAPLARIRNASFFSLQKDTRPSWGTDARLNIPIHDCTRELRDFADTAALITHLDVVISADTAVAHLAGALGKRVWTLIPFVPDWRWGLDRCDSPWYPTMRLFRQKKFGNWESVIENVAEELQSVSGREFT